MSHIKFTNVKFYIGGGKKSLRIRKNQNYTIYINTIAQEWLLNLSKDELVDKLYWLTKGRAIPTKETKAIIKS